MDKELNLNDENELSNLVDEDDPSYAYGGGKKGKKKTKKNSGGRKRVDDDEDDEDKEEKRLDKNDRSYEVNGVNRVIRNSKADKFSVLCEIPELIDTEEVVLDTIEVLREGEFVHPEYGQIKFDLPLFRELIENFESNILQRQVSIDRSHEPKEGAVAWVKRLFVTQRPLNGKLTYILNQAVEWNPLGLQLKRDKIYKYFSSEFSTNYADNETGEEFGAVMTGGGVTNRPFVTGLKPYTFSEDGKQVIFQQSKEIEEFDDNKMQKVDDKQIIINLRKSEDSLIMASKEKTLELIGKLKKQEAVDLSELEDLEKDLSSPTEPEKVDAVVTSVPDEPVAPSLEEKSEPNAINLELDKRFEEFDRKLAERDQAITKLTTELTQTKDDNVVLTKGLQEVTAHNKQVVREGIESKNQALESKFKRDGHAPALLEVAMSLIRSDKDRRPVFKFSQLDDEKNETILDLSVTDVVTRVLDSIPKHQLIDYSVKTDQFNDENSTFTKTDEHGGIELEGVNDDNAIVAAMKRAKLRINSEYTGSEEEQRNRTILNGTLN